MLHFASGPKKISGMINIDGNPLSKADMIFDMRVKLPFSDNSTELIYTAHALEHFYPNEIISILNEFYRIIKPSGTLRIVVPDMEKSIHAYINKDNSFFSGTDYYKNFNSFGGRFSNFNFCDGQHRMGFDFDFMSELLKNAGFVKVIKQDYNKSLLKDEYYSVLKGYEEGYKNNSIFVETIK